MKKIILTIMTIMMTIMSFSQSLLIDDNIKLIKTDSIYNDKDRIAIKFTEFNGSSDADIIITQNNANIEKFQYNGTTKTVLIVPYCTYVVYILPKNINDFIPFTFSIYFDGTSDNIFNLTYSYYVDIGRQFRDKYNNTSNLMIDAGLFYWKPYKKSIRYGSETPFGKK